MLAYYNEIDPFAAAWLRNLIAAGLIAPGEVDTRSIADVRATDLVGFVQCHFFAGIGGWSLALRMAGWSDDRAVWTGSCPCQPFSGAGLGLGTADERHLWPELARLIAECSPPVCFGEQVASAAGRSWLASVRADLEGMAYGVGAADLCAAGAGAPHIRQRLFWVADSRGVRRADGAGRGPAERATRGVQGENRERERLWPELVAGGGGAGGLVDAIDARLEGHGRPVNVNDSSGWPTQERYDAAPGFWGASDWIRCSDGTLRPVEPGTFPLAHGVPARVGRLRGYGNAIAPEIAAAWVGAFLDVTAAA